MKINDVLYGEFEITEPVLLELLQTPSMLRLKKINQFAIPEEYHEIKSYSRYEHSVGVMLLLRKLGADLEEQVTGLLHDVSHTAFSHLIDLVLGSELEEDYQDKRHHLVIAESEIPSILLRHGLNVGRVSSHQTGSLLERDLPDLCADRVDYGLREIYWIVDKISPLKCVADLAAVDNQMVFKTRQIARLFAEQFLNRQKYHWGNPSHMLRWQVFSDMMKSAVQKGLIKLEDFNLTDDVVIAKLIASNDDNVMSTLNLLKNQKPLNFTLTRTNPTHVLKKKFRFVDPMFTENEKLVRLSDADHEFAQMIRSEKEKNESGVSLIFNQPANVR